jgi:tRNA pseudouridine13 synthase
MVMDRSSLDDLPLITPDILGIGGNIKEDPSHFVVEELPLYQPQGQGEHLYLCIEREGMTTREVARLLAKEFALHERDVGYAGLKDKEAHCTQTFSLTKPSISEAEAARRIRESLGLKVHWSIRHNNKLKRGHLLGNHFKVLVNGVGPEALPCAQAVVEALKERGLPNYFGYQRFGLSGDNAEAGRRILKGKDTGKDHPNKWLRSLMLNAFQSELFNTWLAERIGRGEFARLILGDIAKKTDTGGLFEVEEPLTEQPRLKRGEITYTGPIYGYKMRRAKAEAGAREAKVLSSAGVNQEELKQVGLKGSRRPARLLPGDIQISVKSDEDGYGIWFSFSLPKGSYATVLMREFIK